MISHVSVCLLAHEKMLDFKHFLSCKTGVQLFGSSDRLYFYHFTSKKYQLFLMNTLARSIINVSKAKINSIQFERRDIYDR